MEGDVTPALGCAIAGMLLPLSLVVAAQAPVDPSWKTAESAYLYLEAKDLPNRELLDEAAKRLRGKLPNVKLVDAIDAADIIIVVFAPVVGTRNDSTVAPKGDDYLVGGQPLTYKMRAVGIRVEDARTGAKLWSDTPRYSAATPPKGEVRNAVDRLAREINGPENAAPQPPIKFEVR